MIKLILNIVLFFWKRKLFAALLICAVLVYANPVSRLKAQIIFIKLAIFFVANPLQGAIVVIASLLLLYFIVKTVKTWIKRFFENKRNLIEELGRLQISSFYNKDTKRYQVTLQEVAKLWLETESQNFPAAALPPIASSPSIPPQSSAIFASMPTIPDSPLIEKKEEVVISEVDNSSLHDESFEEPDLSVPIVSDFVVSDFAPSPQANTFEHFKGAFSEEKAPSQKKEEPKNPLSPIKTEVQNSFQVSKPPVEKIDVPIEIPNLGDMSWFDVDKFTEIIKTECNGQFKNFPKVFTFGDVCYVSSDRVWNLTKELFPELESIDKAKNVKDKRRVEARNTVLRQVCGKLQSHNLLSGNFTQEEYITRRFKITFKGATKVDPSFYIPLRYETESDMEKRKMGKLPLISNVELVEEIGLKR